MSLFTSICYPRQLGDRYRFIDLAVTKGVFVTILKGRFTRYEILSRFLDDVIGQIYCSDKSKSGVLFTRFDKL